MAKNWKIQASKFLIRRTKAPSIVFAAAVVCAGAAAALEANIRIEDPGAFVMPWNAVQRWRRVQQGPMYERICAENPFDLHIEDTEPVPHADTPDF